MASFKDRLNWCLEHGSLSRSDVARWFDLHFGTVNNWFTKDSEPRGARIPAIEVKLKQLEDAIKKKRGFPVPFALSARLRPGYIEKIRDGYAGRVSKPRAAKKRVARGRSSRDGARTSRKSARVASKAKRAKRKAAPADHPPTVSA
jgi:hypothetical protein